MGDKKSIPYSTLSSLAISWKLSLQNEIIEYHFDMIMKFVYLHSLNLPVKIKPI